MQSIAQIQRVLAHPPTVSMMRINSGELVKLFEGGWLELGEEGLSRVRVIVACHAAPAPGKNIPVGKRVGEWVYELFITVLDTEGFLKSAFGRATGRFEAEDFVLQEDGKLRCPAGASLWLSEVRQENALS